jgi:hypothetical protein
MMLRSKARNLSPRCSGPCGDLFCFYDWYLVSCVALAGTLGCPASYGHLPYINMTSQALLVGDLFYGMCRGLELSTFSGDICC